MEFLIQDQRYLFMVEHLDGITQSANLSLFTGQWLLIFYTCEIFEKLHIGLNRPYCFFMS